MTFVELGPLESWGPGANMTFAKEHSLQRSIRAASRACKLTQSRLHAVSADWFVERETKQGRLPGEGLGAGAQRMGMPPRGKHEGMGMQGHSREVDHSENGKGGKTWNIEKAS